MTTTNQVAIEATGLVKKYGNTTALAGVDLSVPTGTVLGVLGPNGAGKTTAVRILGTLLRPDAGHATVGGYDVVREAGRVREIIGLTGQYASVDEDMSGRRNLIMIGRLLGYSREQSRARADELLERFELTDAGDRIAKTYSGGMRRRLDLAASLVGHPSILYLDEPTTGLDPHARNGVWETIRNLVLDGTTVLLTTQYLEEADALADSIMVFDKGAVVASGRPAELKAQAGKQSLDVRPAEPAHLERVAAIVAESVGVTPDRRRGERARQRAGDATARSMPVVVRRLDEEGIAVTELSLRLPSLDEVFLALTGHTAEERRRTQSWKEWADDHRNTRHRRPTRAAVTGRSPGSQQSLTLAWRNIVRIRQNPEALADVTFQPIIFLVLFLFVFGGAIASGGTGTTTCRSCCPGCSCRPWCSPRWAPGWR